MFFPNIAFEGGEACRYKGPLLQEKPPHACSLQELCDLSELSSILNRNIGRNGDFGN